MKKTNPKNHSRNKFAFFLMIFWYRMIKILLMDLFPIISCFILLRPTLNIKIYHMKTYNTCDHIHAFSQDETKGNLWLGDYNSARNKRLHKEKALTTIVTAGLGMKMSVSEPTKHRIYRLYDSPNENIEK